MSEHKDSEIDPRWGSGQMPESDINPYEAQRARPEDLKEEAKEVVKGARKGSAEEPEPSNPQSIKPWNTEMVKPDKSGAYRKIK